MFGKTAYLLTVFFVLASPLWAQYQSDDYVIDINDGEIIVSADDYYRHLEGAAASSGSENEVDLSSFDEALEFAADIVKARAIVAEAKKQGYPDDETIKRIKRTEGNHLRETANKNIQDMIDVPEEKIDEFYAAMDTQIKVAIIVLDNEDASRSVYDKLVSGSDFGDLAAENNISDQIKEDRGELLQPINYHFDPTVIAAFELDEPGDFTEPMELPNGNWLIVKLNERVEAFTEENPKPELETVRESISAKYIKSALADFIKETLDNDLTGIEIWRDEELYQKGLTWQRNEVIDGLYGKGLVLARIGEDELMFDDWWPKSEFESTSDEDWEKRRNDPKGDAVVKHLERQYDQKLDDIRLLAWAKFKGLDKEPDVAWDLWRGTSETILDNYTESELLPLLPSPTDEEVRANFEEHKDEYFIKESLSGRLYAFATEAEANDYRAIADEYIPENNMAPDTLITKIVEDYELKTEEGKFSDEVNDFYITYRGSREPELERKVTPEVSDELANDIFGIAYDLETHVYSPVYPLANGRFAFFWNRYYKPFRFKEFDEVKDRIYHELNNELINTDEATAIVDKWIEDIAAKYDYIINEDTARAVYDKWQADNTAE